MTADLAKNTLTGKEVKIPQDDVSERAETVAFLEGIAWITGHMREAALRIGTDERGTIKVDGKPAIDAILRMGSPAFADHLRKLAEHFEQEGFKEAHKRFPKFDRIPAPSKGGESTGF